MEAVINTEANIPAKINVRNKVTPLMDVLEVTTTILLCVAPIKLVAGLIMNFHIAGQ